MVKVKRNAKSVKFTVRPLGRKPKSVKRKPKSAKYKSNGGSLLSSIGSNLLPIGMIVLNNSVNKKDLRKFTKKLKF
jgi:hypothetical protein